MHALLRLPDIINFSCPGRAYTPHPLSLSLSLLVPRRPPTKMRGVQLPLLAPARRSSFFHGRDGNKVWRSAEEMADGIPV